MSEPFPGSQCLQCVHVREVTTARSVFLQCTQGTPPKYPHQPVRSCTWHRSREAPPGSGSSAG